MEAGGSMPAPERLKTLGTSKGGYARAAVLSLRHVCDARHCRFSVASLAPRSDVHLKPAFESYNDMVRAFHQLHSFDLKLYSCLDASARFKIGGQGGHHFAKARSAKLWQKSSAIPSPPSCLNAILGRSWRKRRRRSVCRHSARVAMHARVFFGHVIAPSSGRAKTSPSCRTRTEAPCFHVLSMCRSNAARACGAL